MTSMADDVVVTNNPDENRFEAHLDGALAGFAAYQLTDELIVFIHTEVDGAFEGKGVGSALARSTVSGLTKSNTCTEGGDPGGSWMAGNLAQGVTSGGAGYGANGVCGQKVGQPNIAYFQPVDAILSVDRLTLKTA